MVKISLYLVNLFRKKPYIPIITAILLTIFSVFILYRAEFGQNLNRYVPEDAVRTQAYLEALEHLGGEQSCYIILQGDISQILAKVEKIQPELEQLPEILEVNYKVKDELKDFYVTQLKKRLPLYIPPETFDKFLYRISPGGMEAMIRKTQMRIMMPGGGEIGRFDPLGLTDFIGSIPESGENLDKESGYYLLRGGNGLVLLAEVSGDPRDISFDRKLLQGIEDIMNKNITKEENITFRITGSHAITYHEAMQMKRDMQRNIIFSLLLVSAVIFLFTRELRVMIYAFLPVGLAILITLAFYYHFLGNLTEAAGGFGAILIGLGVDLAVVLYVRHLFLRNIDISVHATSRAIWTGALTTWATFFPMVISSFLGIKEIGILTSAGIIFCALILFGLIAGFMRPGRHTLATYSFSRMTDILLKQKTVCLITLLLILSIPFSIWIIKDINFSIDLKELGSGKNPARIALNEIIQENDTMFLLGEAENMEDANKKVYEAERILKASGVNNIISISTFVPSLERQRLIIERLGEINPEDVTDNFVSIAKKAGLSQQFISEYVVNLREMLSVSTPIRIEDIKKIGFIKDKFLWNDEKGVRYLMVLKDVGDEKVSVLDDVVVTGRDIIKGELVGFLQSDAIRISLIGCLLVNLILFWSFRSLKDILFVQIPILLGILFTGVVLTVTGRGIHILSAITGVMLFGIGTDYAIHFVHHLGKETDVQKVFSQTGSAITISALTTICGFGSLFFSSYRGLSDMGFTVAVGTAINLILVFLFVPLYRDNFSLSVRRHKSTR